MSTNNIYYKCYDKITNYLKEIHLTSRQMESVIRVQIPAESVEVHYSLKLLFTMYLGP